MTRRSSFTTKGVASLARTSLALLAVALSCGGKSVRYVEEATGGEGDDPTTGGRSGSSNGGRGGSGAVDPFGGTSGTSGAFTGGTFTGGSAGTLAVGGTAFTGGTSGTGGTIPRGGTSFTGGTAGTGTGGCYSGPEPVLVWDRYGSIFPNQNLYGLNGGWYTFDDCDDAVLVGLPCTVRSPALIGPDGEYGWTVARTTTVCASGSAPRVEIGPDGVPAYAIQWGFGMGFSLNGGAPFDAVSQCIRGFVFELFGTAPATLRVNVVTPKTLGESHFVETPLSSMAFVDFASARQGSWVVNPVPLDITQVTDIQFHVYTNEATTTPFNFCVNNVRALH
jgi:hypothetical protein